MSSRPITYTSRFQALPGNAFQEAPPQNDEQGLWFELSKIGCYNFEAEPQQERYQAEPGNER